MKINTQKVEKSIACITMERMDNRLFNSVGSSRIRMRWLLPYWEEAEEYVIGKKYEIMIFQKVYWGAMMEAFEGIKLLDLCVSGDTLVFTDKGWKYAKEISIGDVLLTYNGTFEPVKRIFKRESKVRKVKSRGLPELSITYNHKVPYIKQKYNGYGQVEFGSLKNKRVEELEVFKRHKGGDCLLTLLNREKIEAKGVIDEDMGWFWGYYSAEGSHSDWGINFSMNQLEEVQKEKIISIITNKFEETKIYIYDKIEDKTRNIRFYNKELLALLRNKVFTKDKKTVIPEVFFSTRETKLKFLEGYIAGDGYCNDVGGISISSVSKKLAYSVFQLFLDCGFNPSMNYHKRDGESCAFTHKNGKVYKGNPCWKIQLNPKDSIKFCNLTNIKKFKICKIDYWKSLISENVFVKKVDNYLTRPINSISEDGEIPVDVFNFTVGESHSYIADSLIVLNCDPDWLENKPVFEFVDMVDAVTTSTEALAGYVKKMRPNALVKYIPDRIYLPESIPLKVEHADKIKKVVWFGYSQNVHYLEQVFDELITRNIGLVVISDQEFTPTLAYRGKIDIHNIPYSYQTYIKDIVQSDAVIMPDPFGDERSKYKSNNKLTQAWALGMPVIRLPQDFGRLATKEARIREVQEKRKEIEEKWDCRISVREYQSLIEEIKQKKVK